MQRLIAVLDTGSRADTAVSTAYDQLSYLGALVVPPLLDAVPTFGPFGLRNALQLLAPQDDARIAQVLARRLDDADPAVTSAIVGFLDDAKPAVHVPLAVKVAAITKEPGELLSVLRVLVDKDGDNPAARATAEKLVTSESPKVLAELLDSIDNCTAAWVPDVLDRLRQRGDDNTRAVATYHWLMRQPDLTQDRALQALQQAPAGSVCWIAARFAQRDPTWNRVALLALRSSVDEVWRNNPASFDGLGRVVWGDLRDEAAAAMLAVPRVGNRNNDLYQMMVPVIASGWKVPEGSELRLIEQFEFRGGEAWQMLLQALPMDGEARALTLWRTLPREQQDQLVFAAKDRAWHRLVASHLLASEQQTLVHSKLLERDWTGIPPDASAMLAQLAARWPTPPVGWSGWQPSLLAAWTKTPAMPPEVILPLLDTGDRNVWQALFRRDPQKALVWLRTASNRDAVDVMHAIELLRRLGTDQDVALAIWCVSRIAGQPPGGLTEFFADHGRGNLDVIALGKLPVSVHPNMTSYCLMVAAQAGRDARIEDLDALLTMLPDLGDEAAGEVLSALRRQVRPTDAERIVAAIEATATRPQPASILSPSTMPNAGLAARYLGLLDNATNPAVLPRLRTLLGQEAFRELRGAIARACLAIGGEGKKALLGEFLKGNEPEIVAAAIAAPELRDDAALRELGAAALLRLGERMAPIGPDWRSEDLERAARAVVNDERFPQFSVGLSRWAVSVLGRRKDTTFLNEIASATRHKQPEVLDAAALALGNTFSRDAAPPLLELLKHDSTSVQKAAQAALDRIANYLDERKKWEERLK